MDVTFTNGNYNFNYRASALILNKDLTKILLFKGESLEFYMLIGGKVALGETSFDGIKREVFEETGLNNIEFSLLGIQEAFGEAKGYNNHLLNIIYKGVFKEEIIEEKFYGPEGNWATYEWIDIDKLDNIPLFPNEIKTLVNESDKFHHLVNHINK